MVGVFFWISLGVTFSLQFFLVFLLLSSSLFLFSIFLLLLAAPSRSRSLISVGRLVGWLVVGRLVGWSETFVKTDLNSIKW